MASEGEVPVPVLADRQGGEPQAQAGFFESKGLFDAKDLKLTYYTFPPVPNPRLVDTFAREKGIDLSIVAVNVDLLGAANRSGEHMKRNPMGQLPYFQLEDGTVIADTIAMCEYLEEVRPDTPLFGASPQERGNTRMWQRRMEEHFVYPAFTAFRWWTASDDCVGDFKDFFKGKAPVLLGSAYKDMQAWAVKQLEWLEAQKQASPSEFIAGDKFTVVDIQVMTTLDFFKDKSQPFLEEHGAKLPWVMKWYEAVVKRESYQACLAHIASM